MRRRKTVRDRDQRLSFTPDQMRLLFESPVHTGSLSERDRLAPGPIVVHDALYWVPIIAAYTLMRREEICGLMVSDIKLDAPIPSFSLVFNKYRRLKNA